MKIVRAIGTLLIVLGILFLAITVTTFIRDFSHGLFHFMGGQVVIMAGCIIAIVVGGVLRKQGKEKK